MPSHPPDRVVHADWSAAPGKRWAADAVLREGRYVASAPRIVVDPVRDAVRAGRPCLLGFDFPIGVPAAYARRVRVASFLELLPELGRGAWAEFFEPAARPEEIGLRRPFYPRRPGGTSQRHLLDALGFDTMDELRRRCERAYAGRRAAEVSFWTLGPKQVGRAAIAGWRDLLIPALSELSIWPFQGELRRLRRSIVVCETYPAEFYTHLGLARSKTAAVRAAAASSLRAAAARLELDLEPGLAAEIQRGFTNDDAYDAFVGLLGMLNVLRGNRLERPELEARLVAVEGWILGQTASGASPTARARRSAS